MSQAERALIYASILDLRKIDPQTADRLWDHADRGALDYDEQLRVVGRIVADELRRLF